MELFRFILAAALLLAGMFMFVTAAFGVNRYQHALNRIHTAALGDTLGIAFCILAMIVWKGISFVSFKMLIVVIFFWLASPVASHMLAALELETDGDLGPLERRDIQDPAAILSEKSQESPAVSEEKSQEPAGKEEKLREGAEK